jgi:pilus assembly protein FimV
LESGQGAAAAPASVDFNLDFESKPAKTSQVPVEPAFDMSFDLDTSTKSASAADSASSFDMDFNIGTSEATDTSSNLIDFKSTETAASDFDFSTTDSSTAHGADVEFSLGGMGESVTELETASEGATAEGSLPGWDETATKLDLAKAYIDMGDTEGARSILDEVLAEGNDSQKQQARNLAAQIAA